MSRIPARSSFAGIGSAPPFRYSRSADRPHISQNNHCIRGDFEIWVINSAAEFTLTVKDERGAAVLHKLRTGSARFDDCAIWCQISGENSKSAGFCVWGVQRGDDVIAVLRRPGRIQYGFASDGNGVSIQQWSEFVQHGGNSAGLAKPSE